ncbi:MAG: hypothetical protein OXK80_04610 [Bdellovibrionales bacterium]|nr:hypothetical protein [Bdellovibrionales bacterium]
MECPHCQNQIEAPDLWEFFDCTACGASLQLENNELKLLKAPNENTSTHYEQKPQQPEASQEERHSHEGGNPVPEDFPEPPISTDTPPFPAQGEHHLQEENHAHGEHHPQDTLHSQGELTPSKDRSGNPVQESFSQPSFSAEENPSSQESDNLSNILDFGNVHNQKNHFTYYLHINEISSKAVFDKIRHILKSPRVRLDCPNQPSNNTLTINNLSAVQMVYLVRKLSPLSVKIHWTQKSTLTE